MAPSSSTSTGTAAASGQSTNIFTYLYNQFQTTIATPVQNGITSVINAVQPFVLSLLTLTIMVLGVMAFAGRFPADALFYRLIRISFVVPLVSLTSGWYQNYVVAFFQSLPTQISSSIAGTTSTNPAAPFDIVIHSYNQAAANISWGLPWGVSSLFYDVLVVSVGFVVVLVFTALLFGVWFLIQSLLVILLMLGPIFVLGLLFDYFRGWFDRWIGALLGLCFASVATTVLTQLMLNIMNGYLQSLPAVQSSATQAAMNLVGIIGIVVVMAVSTALLPILLQSIAATTGLPGMGHYAALLAWVGRGAARGAAGTAGRVIGGS